MWHAALNKVVTNISSNMSPVFWETSELKWFMSYKQINDAFHFKINSSSRYSSYYAMNQRLDYKIYN